MLAAAGANAFAVCSSNADCGSSGLVCSNSGSALTNFCVCPNQQKLGGQCATNADCGGYLVCDSGKCWIPNGGSCFAASTKPSGWECENHFCNANGVCAAPTGPCVGVSNPSCCMLMYNNPAAFNSCSVDADCGPGLVCPQVTAARAYKFCVCPEYIKLDTSCNTHADCGFGMQCYINVAGANNRCYSKFCCYSFKRWTKLN